MNTNSKSATISLEKLFETFAECSPDQARALASNYTQLEAARRACPRHEFALDARERQICIHCKWAPTNAQLAAYRQGLEHGRSLRTNR
jgi:hypothetical protein